MNILKQIKTEIVNLLKMKFIVIVGVIVFIIGFIGPILEFAVEKYDESQSNDVVYETTIYEGSSVSGTSIVVDGIEISNDNPFFYDVNYYTSECVEFYDENNGNTAEQKVWVQELSDVLAEYYVEYAQEITDYSDYRADLVWQVQSVIAEVYVLEADPSDALAFESAVSYVTYVEDIQGLLSLSEDEKADKIEEKKALLENVDEAILNEDFDSYVDCRITFYNQEIEAYEEQIAIQENAVIKNPDLEESADTEIKRLQEQITSIQEVTIPTWEYRRENEVLPNSDDWRNSALNEIEYATYLLNESKQVITEEEFLQQVYMTQQYGNYATYLKGMEAQKISAQNKMFVAQTSLDTGNPDMKFVWDGARSKVNSNLFYAIVVAVFGILLGGFVIANEFQAGTVRLLMIRPRTRGKVYGTKFAAGAILCYCIYFTGMLTNIMVNGILSGFGDYGNPNYTANGPVNFWVMIIGRILICSVVIIFSYSFAYALSAIIKNSAIAIALPSAGVFGGMLAASILSYSKFARLLAYTPLPYLNMASFYQEYGTISSMIEKGANVSQPLGIVMLLVLSLIFYIVGVLVFKNTDITN